MITASAPGKLFVAGEYAVVEPGQPSVLVAVDRFLTVSVEQSDAYGQVHSDAYGRLPVTWTRDAGGVRIDAGHHPSDYVMATITLVDRLRAELRRPESFFDLRIASELDDRGGRKFGLGSSAAVTVATVAALDEHFALDLSAMQRFRLAMLATISVVPTASGGDLAASTFGGWIGYRSPDRDALVARMQHATVAELLSEPWDGLEVTRIEPPASLRLLVGWTGAPASTERLVDRVLAMRDAGDRAHGAFLDASRHRVDQLTEALRSDDLAGALDAVRACRSLLRDLGAAAGIDIETDRLRALCDDAERAGAAAKPSGAGGGDCGIALAPPDADVQGMHRAWEADDVRHLTLSVTSPRSDVDG